ncbi:MAG: DUF4139 domain-containing protein [Candidatus Eremiobacteraeota bacterium]|nr:DUF4139 domain-containing protein [Candidatus Eremiobacteraeota bacterium]
MTRALLLAVAVVMLLIPQIAFAGPRERTSSVGQREAVNLTVYNAGTALVHDRRRLHLDAGLNRIAWRDVSAQMDPTTAFLTAIGGSNQVNVVEQNFDFDLFNPSALLERYIGKEVIVVHDPRFAGERETRETARVLSTASGIVLQYHDRIETELRGHIAYPVSSSTFRDRPTLVLDLASRVGGQQTLDLSYLTSGLRWNADYMGVLSSDERLLSLTGLVTLSNMSGASYRDARLQLVAGNVNIIQPQMLRTIANVTSRSSADTYSVGRFGQENYFEYHLYTLGRQTTILDKQTKQISLLSARDIPIRKTLELRGSQQYYRAREPDLGDRLPVGVFVTFQNHGGDLGTPLPAGGVRLYKKDSRGLSQFLGSDQITHTPSGEIVRLNLGNSFDVTARKRQTTFNEHVCLADSSYEIVISDAKTIAEDVLVVESIPGSWEIESESSPHLKSSASTASWVVHVPAEGHATLTYSARTSWC